MLNRILSLVFILTTIVTLACFTNTAKSGAVKSGLIAYWTFDKGTIEDQTVKDLWGDSPGEIKGDPEVVEGKIGEGLLLDGDVDFVFVQSEAINRDYSAITLECWVYINALDDSWNRILTLDGRTGGGGNDNCTTLYYDDDDNEYGFFVNNQSDLIQEDIPTEEWIHMIGTWDGETANYYENGNLEKTFPVSGTIQGSSLALGIGDRSDDGSIDAIQGIVDEVRIYETALSESEVKQNYAAEGLAVVEPNPKLSITWGKIKASSQH